MFTMDMIEPGTLLVLIISCFFIYSTWNQMYRRRNLPPGPVPLPLIGNLLQIKRGEMAKSLMKLWKQYGPVYTLYLGTRPVVVVCGYQAVKEALVDQGEEFGARGRVPTLGKFTGDYGISLSNGERWKQMRTFAFKTLRNFGFGKKSTETKIQEMTQILVDELRKLDGVSVDPSKLIMEAVTDIFCYIIFGNRFECKDESYQKLLFNSEKIFYYMSTTWGQMEDILPGLMKYIPGPHKRISSLSQELVDFIEERVKINQETLDPNSPRDFIDCFLAKMQQEKQNPRTEFTMKNLLISVHNLLIAATDSITTTVRHGLLILVTYPEIQAKLHNEIDQIIGRGRMPKIEDRGLMSYMDAVINELHRFVDLAPLNTTHSVTRDTQFRGYTIPKGTDIFPLLCTVHRDPTQFSTPYEFNPNHFLDDNGKFKKNDAMMAFSAGKRKCPGEILASAEVFLLLTTMLQNFRLTSEKKFTLEDISPKLTGFLNHPIPLQLSFIPR